MLVMPEASAMAVGAEDAPGVPPTMPWPIFSDLIVRTARMSATTAVMTACAILGSPDNNTASNNGVPMLNTIAII
jgi:hypothetical protein